MNLWLQQWGRENSIHLKWEVLHLQSKRNNLRGIGCHSIWENCAINMWHSRLRNGTVKKVLQKNISLHSFLCPLFIFVSLCSYYITATEGFGYDLLYYPDWVSGLRYKVICNALSLKKIYMAVVCYLQLHWIQYIMWVNWNPENINQNGGEIFFAHLLVLRNVKKLNFKFYLYFFWPTLIHPY